MGKDIITINCRRMGRSPYIIAGIILLTFFVGSCKSKTVVNRQGEEPVKSIEDVLREHTKELMSIAGVMGTAQGLCDGKPCIKVFVDKETRKLKKEIPDVIEGYRVVVQATGEIRALQEE